MRINQSRVRFRALLAATALVATFGPLSAHVVAAAPARNATVVTLSDDGNAEVDGLAPGSANVFVPGDHDDA